MLKKILKSEKGNVAFIFSLFLTPAFLLVAASLDFSNTLKFETKLQAIADVTALAGAASSGTDKQAIAIADQYLYRNLISASFDLKGITASIIVKDPPITSSRTVQVLLGYKVPMTFAKIISLSNFQLKADAIAKQGNHQQGDIEMTLVLDVGTTMHHGNRLHDVKKEILKLIDLMYSPSAATLNVIMSIVPYAGGVHFGQGYTQYLSSVPRKWEGCFDLNTSTRQTYNERVFRLGGHDSYQPSGQAVYECPTATIFPVRDDIKALKKRIGGLNPLGYGKEQIGAAVGFKTLSPNWQGRFPGGVQGKPAAYSNAVTKIMIIVGDIPPYRLYGTPAPAPLLEKVCTAAKARNIQIYTMPIMIYPGANLMRDTLENCASSPQQYYHVQAYGRPTASGPRITDAFNNLISTLKMKGHTPLGQSSTILIK